MNRRKPDAVQYSDAATGRVCARRRGGKTVHGVGENVHGAFKKGVSPGEMDRSVRIGGDRGHGRFILRYQANGTGAVSSSKLDTSKGGGGAGGSVPAESGEEVGSGWTT